MKGLSFLHVREMLKKELRQMFRDPRMGGIVFVSPIIQLIVFGYAVNTDIRHTATFIVDQDGTKAARELVEAFTSTGYFQVVGASQDPADLVGALDHGDAIVGLHIPNDFARKLPTAGGATVQVVIDGTNSNTGTVAQGYAAQIVQEFALERAAPDLTTRSSGLDLRFRAWYNPELESRVYNVPGVIGILLLLMSLLLTALAVVRERELGTLDQLAVSPLTARELMVGKTMPVALVGVIDLILITAVAILWFDIPFRGSALALLFAAILYIAAGISFGLLISTISRTQQEAIMSMFLFMLPAIILSGFFYPISSMPEIFQHMTLLNPVRHFLEIVRAIFLKGVGLSILWPKYVALVVMAAGALWLAIVRFRRTIAS